MQLTRKLVAEVETCGRAQLRAGRDRDVPRKPARLVVVASQSVVGRSVLTAGDHQGAVIENRAEMIGVTDQPLMTPGQTTVGWHDGTT